MLKIQKIFFTSNKIRQVHLIQRLTLNLQQCCYGVSSLHYQQAKLYSKLENNTINNANNLKNISDNNQKLGESLSNNNNFISKRTALILINQFLTYIEILKNDLKDKKLNYNTLLETIKIFSNLKSAGKIDDSLGIFLLECCGDLLPDISLEKRQELVNFIWDLLENGKSSNLTLDHYHSYLNVCAQNLKTINPDEFLNNMKTSPNKETYLHLLDVFAAVGDLENLHFILLKIKQSESPEASNSPEIITVLVKAFTVKNDLKSAHALIDNFKATNCEIDDEIYGYLACSYAQQGDISKAQEILESHSLITKQILTVIKNLILSSKGSIDITNIVSKISVKDAISDPFLVNVINELTQNNKSEYALFLIHHLSLESLPSETLNIVKYFLKSLVKSQLSISTIINIGNGFYQKYDFNTICLTMLEESLISGRTELSLLLLEELTKNDVEIRPHYYWPILMQKQEEMGESGIYEMIDHSAKTRTRFDLDTMFYYVLPYITVGEPFGTLRNLTIHSMPLPAILTPLVKFYLHKGQSRKALLLCKSMFKKVDYEELLPVLVNVYRINPRNLDAIVKILRLPKDKDYPGRFIYEVINDRDFSKDLFVYKKLLEAYKKNGLSISSFAATHIDEYAFKVDMDEYRLLLKDSGIVDNSKASPLTGSEKISGMTHPKNMDAVSLECHLIELLSKDMNYKGTLRKLLFQLCADNDVKRADVIRNFLKKNNLKLTPGMRASLSEVYARNERAEEAYDLLIDLQQNVSDMPIDTSKILTTATGLVKADKIDKAFKLMEGTTTIPFQSSRGCWNLLNAMVYSKKPELLSKMFDILVSKGYCEITNALMGPFVRQYLLRDDLIGAIEEFKRIAKNYRFTPLRQELLSLLLQKIKEESSEDMRMKYQSMFDSVLKIIVDIHDKDLLKIDLTAVYAQLNMVEEVKVMLETTENLDFVKMVGAMKDDVKQKVLMTILDASSGILTIDRHMICELLFGACSTTGNVEGAKSLWKKMEAENIRPSQLLTTDFYEFLSKHKETI